MRTRFAPAPTGFLHLGHVANALYVWGVAQADGAEVLLRIEDHDRQRCRREYELALLDDLDWLGFRPDVGATDDFRGGSSPYRQSDCGEAYEAAVAELRSRGHRVYVCDCSRRELAELAGDEPDRETPYSGRCRDRGLIPGPGRGLRVAIAPGSEAFEDLRLGQQVQEPASQCGDVLIRDRLGNWTYQFAVVVDDQRHGVDLVIRGEDLLPSTGRQLHLARMLGRTVPPRFLHHPLIRKPDGAKLSKAARDTSIRELRAAGTAPGRVLGLALVGIGLSAPQPRSMEEALARVTTG